MKIFRRKKSIFNIINIIRGDYIEELFNITSGTEIDD